MEKLLCEGPFVRLLQSIETSGTASIRSMAGNKVRVIPSKKCTDGTIVWADVLLDQSIQHMTITDFPISLFARLRQDELFEGEVCISIAKESLTIYRRDDSMRLECANTKVSLDTDLSFAHIPDSVKSPDISVKLPSTPLTRLHARLYKFRKIYDTVLVSANYSGNLLITMSSPHLDMSLEFPCQVMQSQEAADEYQLFGVRISLPGLLRVLRVAGCGVEQTQVAICNRNMAIFTFSTNLARITALLPHNSSAE